MNLLTYIGKALAVTVASVAMLFGTHSAPPQSFGSYNPTGGGTYRIQSSVSSSAATITLTSFKEPVSGIAYTMTYLNSSIEYGTLEPQTSTKEFISFTGITQNSDGSAMLTGVTRGLGFSYPYTSSTTLQQTHPAQSIFILSNPPQLTNQYANKSNNETISGDWLVPDPVNSTSVANREYVDGKIFGGIGNASETATGTVEIATQLEAASSTMNGTLGRLAIPSSLSTSTRNSNTASLVVPVTKNNGRIDNSFIDPSQSLQLGSTTFTFPSSIGASSTVMVTNGSGALTNAYTPGLIYNTNNANITNSGGSTTTVFTLVLPAASIASTTSLDLTIGVSGSSDDCLWQYGLGTGSATTSIAYLRGSANGSGNAPLFDLFRSTLYASTTATTDVLTTGGGGASYKGQYFMAPVPNNALSYFSIGTKSISGSSACRVDKITAQLVGS